MHNLESLGMVLRSVLNPERGTVEKGGEEAGGEGVWFYVICGDVTVELEVNE